MIAGYPPFNGKSKEETLKNIMNDDIDYSGKYK